MIIAVIVTYNPEPELLRENIAALVGQVAEVIVMDNASQNIDEINAVCEGFDNVTLKENSENLGLPVNYNRAADYADKRGAEWLLIMDQDTVVPTDLIEKYSRYMGEPKTAIICPYVWDINECNEEVMEQRRPKSMWSRIKYCISSASLNRISTLKKLGGFDEKLFIDMVDTDYCIELARRGYDVVQVNDCVVQHQNGKKVPRRFLWKKINVNHHNAMRIYHMFRNRTYCARKYGKTPFNDYEYFRRYLVEGTLIFYEEDKREKFRMVAKGIIDGLKM